MLVYPNGDIVGTIGGGQVEHRMIAASLLAMKEKKPKQLEVHLTRDLGMCCGGKMQIFIDPLEPNPQITVFGAGHVALALVPLLIALEWEVTVVDDRPELLTSERFPKATRVLQDGLQVAVDQLGKKNDFFLVVTHDHQRDQDIVERLLPKSFCWLGLIGSRSKVARFFVRYRAAGIDEALFQKLSAPVGLDIGAQTPVEIAIAIAAEIIRVRRGQSGPPRALSENPIPARGGDGIALPPGLADATLKTAKPPS